MKVKRRFPIFNSHLDLAHHYWNLIIQENDWAIDATCGNGHDTLFLAKICLGVIALDIQENALTATRALLFNENLEAKVHLFNQSHETFPIIAHQNPVRLIVYNLGYLPGGNKSLVTQVNSTLTSIKNGLNLLLPGGAISITCYPGHPEGEREQEELLTFCKGLDPAQWNVCFHSWNNRNKSPSLLLIQKNT